MDMPELATQKAKAVDQESRHFRHGDLADAHGR